MPPRGAQGRPLSEFYEEYDYAGPLERTLMLVPPEFRPYIATEAELSSLQRTQSVGSQGDVGSTIVVASGEGVGVRRRQTLPYRHRRDNYDKTKHLYQNWKERVSR